MKYGVIDITSTSISLKIYDVEALKSVFSSRSAFSAQSFTDGGRLSEHGVQKIVRVLKRMQEECSKYGAKAIYAISSSVVRNLTNAMDVGEEIKALTGITVNVLDAQTEAYCDYVSNKPYYGEECALIDVSGASVAICDMADDAQKKGTCLDFGALTVQKKFVSGVFPTKDECEDIKKYLKKQLKKSLPEIEKKTAVLTGNISRSIYAIYSDVFSSEEGEAIQYEKLKKLLKKLVENDDRAYIVMKSAPEKIYFITVALIIALEILKRIAPEEILISERGVKEGYLSLCLKGEINGVLSPLSVKKERVKIDTVEELAEHIKKRSKGPSKKKKTGKKPSLGAATTKSATKIGRPRKKAPAENNNGNAADVGANE